MRIYTGIGSRKFLPNTPEFAGMLGLGSVFAKKGLLLRSGGAIGCDSAFEKGCDAVGGEKVIFLHRSYANGRKAEGKAFIDSPKSPMWKEAQAMAARFHPYWKTMGQSSKDLHARNVFQVLGYEMNEPTDFVVFAAEPVEGTFGIVQGGTNTAVQVAISQGIPTFNLLVTEEVKNFSKFLQERGLLPF